MKRSGLPRRKTALKRGDKPLRANPETTRAFVERGREKARDRARDAEEGLQEELRRADGQARRGERGRTTTLPQKPRKSTQLPGPSREEAERMARVAALQVRFRAQSPARDHVCARCAAAGHERRATSWHHWLPQQHIRVYVRGRRLSSQTTRAILRKLLADERNLVALCTPCHDAHELRSRPLSGEEVPHKARIFALELGPEWAERLRRMYPGGQS